MPKFEVKYKAKCRFIGTIEAANLEEAEKKWNEGFTPFDESETDRGDEDLLSLEAFNAPRAKD